MTVTGGSSRLGDKPISISLDAREVGHVGRGHLAVVRQPIDAVVTEEVFGAVGQFEDDALGRVVCQRPEVGDAAGDGHLLATPVAGPCCHTRASGESG